MFYRKWKIRNVVVLDVRSATHLETFLIKQGVLFFARLQCFRRVQRRARAIACLICRSLENHLNLEHWKNLYIKRRCSRFIKSSFSYSRSNKYQTHDGKSNTATPITPDLSGRLSNYLYPQHYGQNQNYMYTPTDRWYPVYQFCKMVSKV